MIFTTQQDHQNMLQQLGITKLRPGRNGDAKAQNGANYDEANANPYPNLPDVMKLASGEQVTTPEQWQVRRAEIVELLESEVYGRVPANVPGVKWEVCETREIEAGGKPAIQKHIVGVVDNSTCPEIKVNISMSLTLPKDVTEPVPVLMSFGWTPFEPSPFNFGGRGGAGGPRPPSKEDKLIAIKYAADESSFGRRTADDLPVDSHMTLALCAPRLTFISHGIPEKGDANWLDHQGSFMAAIAAQPVFRFLRARDLGRSDDYKTERMPAVNVDMLDGELAWRQHDGGHTDEPNIEHFIRWAAIRFAKVDGR